MIDYNSLERIHNVFILYEESFVFKIHNATKPYALRAKVFNLYLDPEGITAL